jgi:hypothetical protein
MTKHLVLNSNVIDHIEGVRLILGAVRKEPRNPLFVEDKPWEVRFDNLYPNVIFDDKEGLYRCWYSPFILDDATAKTSPEERKHISYRSAMRRGGRREMGVCYAVSEDGILWEKPELGIVDFNGSKRNNLVIRRVHGSGVMRDIGDPDPSRRYKMFLKKESDMAVAFSADGLHWSEPIRCPEIKARGDTHNNAFRDERSGGYVGITRLWKENRRIVGRTESPDFLRWTEAVEVLRALPEELHRQTYAMIVFRYADVYLGLLMMFDTAADTVDCELAWSSDTVRWERVCPGTPLIPRGSKGSFDSHCIFAAAYPILRGNELRLYYAGSDGPHTGWRTGGFGLARLRPDGFAGMEPVAPGGIGTIVTKPIECPGERLYVSADAAGGSLRVGVIGAEGMGLDECEPIVADVTDEPVIWRNGRDLSKLIGKPIRLLFELRSARLYAFGVG